MAKEKLKDNVLNVIYIQHPILSCQIYQSYFLNNCHDSVKSYYVFEFNYSNAIYIFNHDIPLNEDYQNWLKSLPEGLAKKFIHCGYDSCKSIYDLKKYTKKNRNNDIRQFLKSTLNAYHWDIFIEDSIDRLKNN